MNKTIGALLFLCLLILPVAMVVGFSYAGPGHPVENRVVTNDAFLDRSQNDIEIVFFGFAGCADVCPASLAKLASVLESDKVNTNRINTGATFIEVKSLQERNGYMLAEQYSSAFSPRIRGYTPDLNSFRELSEEFIIKLYKSRSESGQLSHTDHFFLLIRQQDQWKVKRVLDQQISESRMIEIIEKTAKEL